MTQKIIVSGGSFCGDGKDRKGKFTAPTIRSPQEIHQLRLDALREIRQCFANFGYKELNLPRNEKEGERTSAIILTVDTFNLGYIQLRITEEKEMELPKVILTAGLGSLNHMLKIAVSVSSKFGMDVEINSDSPLAITSPKPTLDGGVAGRVIAIVPNLKGYIPGGKIIAYCETYEQALQVYTQAKGGQITTCVEKNGHPSVAKYYVIDLTQGTEAYVKQRGSETFYEEPAQRALEMPL